MRKYIVVNYNESFSQAQSLRADKLATQSIFDSLEDALGSSRWLISGAMYIASYNPTKICGNFPGDFAIEVSR